MTLPICASRTTFDPFNHTAFGASTSIAGAIAHADGCHRPVSRTQDGRLVFQPQAPAADPYTLLKTVDACLRGVTGPLYRFAAGLMRGITPTFAEAAAIPALPAARAAHRAASLEKAIANVPITYVVDNDQMRIKAASTPQAAERLDTIDTNLRDQLRRAAEEHPDTAELIEEGCRFIDSIRIALPEFAPKVLSRFPARFSLAAYDVHAKTMYIGHCFEGMHAVAALIHEFSHVRDFREPKVMKALEYQPERLDACQKKIREKLVMPVAKCLYGGNLNSQDCTDALAHEPLFRTRTPTDDCYNLDLPAEARRLVRRVNFPVKDGKFETTTINYSQIGGPTTCTTCRFEPNSISRKDGVERKMQAWEARLAKVHLILEGILDRQGIEHFYPPELMVTELHASFVQIIPRKIARQVCPELFADQVSKDEL